MIRCRGGGLGRFGLLSPKLFNCGLLMIRKDICDIDISSSQSGMIEEDAALGEHDLLDHPSEGDACKRVSTAIRNRPTCESD